MRLIRSTTPALVLLLAACGHSGSQGQGPGGPGGMPPTQVETYTLKASALADEFKTVGSLRADEAVVVRPELAGKIEKIHFIEGQRVAAGSLLFSLDAALTQADLNEANANLENSRRASERASELAGKQLISRADLDAARASLSVDQARAASARTRLAKTQIRAPFEGVVGLRNVSVGDYVTAGQALVDLVRLDPMEVDFRVPEAQLAKVAVGQKVDVAVDAYPGAVYTGEIVAIDPSIDAAGRSAALRARVGNPDLKLRPGLFAQLRIVFANKPDALLVPEQAIWPMGEKKFVYRVADGAAKLVPVTLGVRQPGWVEVTSGLSAGDEVVTSGQQKIADGTPVKPITVADEASAQSTP